MYRYACTVDRIAIRYFLSINNLYHRAILPLTIRGSVDRGLDPCMFVEIVVIVNFPFTISTIRKITVLFSLQPVLHVPEFI